MFSAPDRLITGLLACDYRETASISADWRRFGKFSRGAFYVITRDCRITPRRHRGAILRLSPGELWHSDLSLTSPDVLVGDGVTIDSPVFEQLWQAGYEQPAGFARRKSGPVLDPDEALDELIGGSDEKQL